LKSSNHKNDLFLTVTKGLTSRSNLTKNSTIISPYSCILHEGKNIIGGPEMRKGYVLSSKLTSNAYMIGSVILGNEKHLVDQAYFDIAHSHQFGKGHRNIRVSCSSDATVSLEINGMVYYTKKIDPGTSIIHNIPIIHSPYSTYLMWVKSSQPSTITAQVDFFELPETVNIDPLVKIATPVFNLLSYDGMMVPRFK